MGVRALVPVGENRWMAPKDVRLIPTLYQRGSKNGLRRLSGALQTSVTTISPCQINNIHIQLWTRMFYCNQDVPPTGNGLLLFDN